MRIHPFPLASLFVAACTAPLPPLSEQGSAPPPPRVAQTTPAQAEAQSPAAQPAPPKVAAAPVPTPAPKAPPPRTSPAPKAPPPKPSAPPKTAAPPKAAEAPQPATTPTPSAPLDLKSLEQRLKDTDAIGVLTKLSLKNQVDDLIGQFREFHSGRRPPTLAELRRPFELLLMKVLSLLQDKDGALARDINASREAIWGVLSDRDKLAQFT